MLSSEEIKNLIKQGEGYNLEFKQSIPSKVRDLTEGVCGFANSAGGIILIGVTDNNKIIGTDYNNSRLSAIVNSITEISPGLHCPVYTVEADGVGLIVIEVPSGNDKPYVFSGSVFVRIGPNTQKLRSAEEMRDFFKDQGSCILMNCLASILMGSRILMIPTF